MLKSDIIWPLSRRFKSHSEWEPIGFFSECLCNSTSFDIKLGFFSSSAISVLSYAFASFIYNGGRMRIIINNILSEQDKEAIKNGLSKDNLNTFDIDDLEKLHRTLSARDRHFFECLAWLIQNKRIEVRVIAPKSGVGIAHTKCGSFSDGVNKVAFDGSCNFTFNALVDNCESITASCSWDSDSENAKIEDIEEDFNNTFDGKDNSVNYLDVNDVICRVNDHFKTKEIEELLSDEQALIDSTEDTVLPPTVRVALRHAAERVKKAIETIKEKAQLSSEDKNLPHFPYPSGPREYQKEAFENWKTNGQKGLFAMATGTGKTITSLNCLYEIYKKAGYYKAIILVPTLTLVDQWEKECRKFNFGNIVKVYSRNKSWQSEVEQIQLFEKYGNSDKPSSYIIISTYASFGKDNVFDDLKDFSRKQLLLIADEAHNMGSGTMLRRLDMIPYLRRIGLSATPERQFDDEGNDKLFSFFGAQDKYTYEYSMEEAINNGVLCRYYYYPHIVRLTDTEMMEYIDISTKLAKFFNFSKSNFPKGDDAVKMLLLRRKQIIHKANNKKDIFKQIVQKRFEEKGSLKYTLVYVPEGNKTDEEADFFESENTTHDEVSAHLIDQYTDIVKNVSPQTTVRQYISNSTDKDIMLKTFAEGTLDVLTSMKCLDEGVDVPRSEMAIFCASTGNPRQFIQRRGRILRTHPDKHIAIIHDLVVAPEVSESEESYRMERNLLETELKRVRDFALLSENLHDTDRELSPILDYYNLSLFE